MVILFMFLLFLTALFLIVLILVQRGKGGGLAGAFGGMGGQSAFGTKAGDLFTRITIGVAVFWILLCVGASSTCPAAKTCSTQLGGTPTRPDRKNRPNHSRAARRSRQSPAGKRLAEAQRPRPRRSLPAAKRRPAASRSDKRRPIVSSGFPPRASLLRDPSGAIPGRAFLAIRCRFRP